MSVRSGLARRGAVGLAAAALLGFGLAGPAAAEVAFNDDLAVASTKTGALVVYPNPDWNADIVFVGDAPSSVLLTDATPDGGVDVAIAFIAPSGVESVP